MHGCQFAGPIAFPVVVPVQCYFAVMRDQGSVGIPGRAFYCIASQVEKDLP